MYLELSQKLHQKESNVDMTNYPKILFTPRFGGWDSIVEDYIYENGGLNNLCRLVHLWVYESNQNDGKYH